jgi:Sec7-like guanine-nucleotide exchange factor
MKTVQGFHLRKGDIFLYSYYLKKPEYVLFLKTTNQQLMVNEFVGLVLFLGSDKLTTIRLFLLERYAVLTNNDN